MDKYESTIAGGLVAAVLLIACYTASRVLDFSFFDCVLVMVFTNTCIILTRIPND